MPLLAIPNISVGVPGAPLRTATTAVVDAGAIVLDLHSDETHNRSVLTVTAAAGPLTDAMVALAEGCRSIDLSTHVGVHPRVGVLDVCPIVPYNTSIDEAIATAHGTGRAIAAEVVVPVFFYGAASTREENRELPDIRRGGLPELRKRMTQGFRPDAGPAEIDPRYGVVLVGARGPLIAFNVWLRTGVDVARSIAGAVREPGRVRALGLPMPDGGSQVSMNLVAPHEVSIADVFGRIDNLTDSVTATEIVGLVEDRFLPDPDAKVTRLLVEPGHSLESALSD